MLQRILLPLAAGVLLFSGCASSHYVKSSSIQPGPFDGQVEVLNPLMAQRITMLTERSPKFRAAWLMIRKSGVPVSIGTDAQLHSELPDWFRDHPDNWAGVTVTNGRKGSLTDAYVALRLDAIQQIANNNPAAGSAYLDHELTRLLVHEIYGHLAPVVAAHDVSRNCPDQLRAGEVTPCVKLREEEIAAELDQYQESHH
jgi:hypothetical protein